MVYKYAKVLSGKGKYVPPIAIAGGFVLEDQIFKGLALGSPFVKLVAMGRSTLTAAMVGKTIGKLIKEGKVPEEYKRYGDDIEEIFTAVSELKKVYKEDWKRILTSP